jgi:hypothetical protein
MAPSRRVRAVYDPAHQARAGATTLRSVMTRSADVATTYRPLHAYLSGRYADTVVLAFSEIEDLLGFALPDQARVRVEWWTDDAVEGSESPRSQAWAQAGRTAKPNLFARNVVFERIQS